MTDCEQAIPFRHYALSAVYNSHINRTGLMTLRFAQTDTDTFAKLRNGYPVALYNLKAIRDLFADRGITCLILRPTGDIDTITA